MESSLRGCVCERYAVACLQGRLHQDAVADPCSPLEQSFRSKCCFPIKVVLEAVGRLDSRLGTIRGVCSEYRAGQTQVVLSSRFNQCPRMARCSSLEDDKGRDEEVEVNDG